MDLDKLLAQLVEKARAALGAQLDAIVLYGSAATGEFDTGRSDVNILLLTLNLDVPTLRNAASLLEWWLDKGHSWPLLLTREEFLASADVFPMELTDIAAARRVLFGAFDAPLPVIPPALHRAQLEHELRSKLLRLRQKAIPLLTAPKDLLRLMENSLPTFLILLRHLLLLSGHPASFNRRDNLVLASRGLGLAAEPFLRLLDTRQGLASPKDVDSVQLFESYIGRIQEMVRAADRLAEPHR
jgi:hypothetical protein